MIKIEEKENNISIDGVYSEVDLRKLEKYPQINKLSLTGRKEVTIKVAKGLSGLKSVKELFLWSSVNRTAMRHVISIPGLEELNILEIQNPGKLKGFVEATDLKIFRCNHYMTEADLFEISKLPQVIEIGVQNSEITKKALVSLLKLPNLISLDLEATRFDDKAAAMMATSKVIKDLSICATKITKRGLKSICQMSQLESLDIWSTDICESDLKLLLRLENLEYLSLGGYQGQTSLTLKGIMPYLEQMPSLRRLWLDGVVLTEAEKKVMQSRYEYFRN